MKPFRPAILACAALLACESPVATTHLQPVESRAASSMSASATGGGQAQLPAGFSELKFSFSAVAREDGSATGQFRQHYESGGGIVDFHGEVTCVSFDPATNRAWVGGVVTQNNSTNPGALHPIHQVGRDVWFRVVDNGEGSDMPDRTTVLGFTGAAGITTSAEYCERQPWAANNANTWAVIRGNIQVRP